MRLYSVLWTRIFPHRAGARPAPANLGDDASRPPSHPENAEIRRRHRRIQGGREGEPENAAGFGRQDDPVVPQARGGVVGAALRLVARPDRRLEVLLLLGAPGLALRLDVVAAHRR